MMRLLLCLGAGFIVFAIMVADSMVNFREEFAALPPWMKVLTICFFAITLLPGSEES